MICAGILAGGIGSRVKGKKIPKQFVMVNNIPMIILTIRKFLGINEIDKIIVAINSQWDDYFQNLLKKYDMNLERIITINGGSTRFESLINIAKKAYELDENSVVISHDCARPFVSERVIIENIKKVSVNFATTTSIRTIDTIITCNEDFESESVPNRDNILLDQGPQAFYSKTFLNLVANIPKYKASDYIEVGKLYLDNNLKVKIILGEETNFKITTDIDFELANFLIEEGIIK